MSGPHRNKNTIENVTATSALRLCAASNAVRNTKKGTTIFVAFNPGPQRCMACRKKGNRKQAAGDLSRVVLLSTEEMSKSVAKHTFTGSFVTQLRESERESEHTTVRSEHTCTGKRVVASIEYIY